MMTKRLFPVLLCAFLITLGACQGEPPTPGSAVQFGQLQKVDGFTYGAEFRETIRVLNCDNPLGRSDTLTEAKMISRNVSWSIVGELGANADVSAVVAGAGVEASIANGYELAVDEELSRGRELELPVSPYASAEYDIVWKPIVWSGFLPFSLQAGEGRIEYLYQQVAFGEVAAYRDHTAEDCGRTAPAPQQTEFAPTAEAVVGTLTPPEEATPLPPTIALTGTIPNSSTPVVGGEGGQPTAAVRTPPTPTPSNGLTTSPGSQSFYPGAKTIFRLYGPYTDENYQMNWTDTHSEAFRERRDPVNTNILPAPYSIPAGTGVFMYALVDATDSSPFGRCSGACFGRLTLYRDNAVLIDNASLWDYHPWQTGGLGYTFRESGSYRATVYFCDNGKFDCLTGEGWQAFEPVYIEVTEP